MSTTPDPGAEMQTLLRDSLSRIRDLRARLAHAESQTHEPIAVVGMACRFPGGARSPAQFWDALISGKDGVREIPESRWAAAGADLRAMHAAGLLDDERDLHGFDAAFFGISPREAEVLDPQHRLLLEVAFEALEDAGIAPSTLAGSRAGAFIGLSTQDYAQRVCARPDDELDVYATTGNGLAFAAGRLAYTLGMQGPALTVDTACSSSLVAVHLACQSLRAQESSLALVGGCNLLLSELTHALVAKTQALSPDGRCKTFDARANGFVRGEGAGLVVLKRLSDAQRDGDRILAVVRGSAINQDGRSAGFTAPNLGAQVTLIKDALARAQLGPERIGYVEAHGTGTPLGDPIELEALREALGAPRADLTRCKLGAVKASVGHLEAAAGIAGFIKTVLALHHKIIPGQLHFESLNPRVSVEGSALEIAARTEPWSEGAKPRCAGVSAFGLSGTNAHAVLEEAPRGSDRGAADGLLIHGESAADPRLFVFSAKSAAAIESLATALEANLRTASTSWPKFCSAAARGRDHHEHRRALVARSAQEAASVLSSARAGEPSDALAAGIARSGRLAFVFSGQGSQWAGMGRELLAQEPLFRARIESLSRDFAQLDPSFDLRAELEADASRSRLAEVDVIPRAIFSLQVALAELLRSWGVQPTAVLGHSHGEIAAAHVAGILSQEEAVRLTVLRSAILREHEREGGAMLTAELSLALAEARLPTMPGPLFISVINGPRSVVFSGSRAAIDALARALEQDGIFCRIVSEHVASHSPLMAPASAALARALSWLSPRAGTLAFISAVTGRAEPGASLDARYWARNLDEPVRFAAATEAAIAAGYDRFLELSGHPLLVPSIRETLLAQNTPHGFATGTLVRNRGADVLLEQLARLYTVGVPIDFAALNPGTIARAPELPSYPWQRRRAWIDAPGRAGSGPARSGDDWFYRLTWVSHAAPAAPIAPPLDTNSASARATHPAPLLLIGDTSGALKRKLTERGERCVSLAADALADRVSFAKRVSAASARAVIFLAPSGGDHDFTTLASQALALTQIVARESSAPKLWLVTQDAQSVLPSDSNSGWAASPLWALGRVFATEHPASWGGLVDLGAESRNPATSAAARDFDALADELCNPSGEDQLALRDGARFAARLEPMERPKIDTPRFSSDGLFIVSGGLGGVGRALSRWLVQRGARELLLVSRSGAQEKDAPFLEELRSAGARVECAALDIGDAKPVAQLFAQLDSAGRAVRGVVHAAGLQRDRALLDTNDLDLRELFSAKANGALLLHEHTRARPLELFLLCSSLAALGGTRGQGAYAAANQLLDGLAHRRRTEGLAALSINWGLWDGGGLVAPEQRVQLERMGLAAMAPARAAAALDALVGAGVAQAMVADLDRDRLRCAMELAGPRPMLRGFGSAPSVANTARTGAALALLESLAAAPDAARRDLVTSFIAARVARVLRIAPGDLDRARPLTQLGLDSLMASELRISASIPGAPLELAPILKGASCNDLAARILSLAPWTAPDLAQQLEASRAISPPLEKIAERNIAPHAAHVAPHARLETSVRESLEMPAHEPLETSAREPLEIAEPACGNWLLVPNRRPEAKMRLVCFPYAGGGPAAFQGWSRALPASIEQASILLPARGSRLEEPPVRSMKSLLEPLVESLIPWLDRPFAFYGHCMGSLLAWEVAQALRDRGLPSPAHFFISAGRAPHCYSPAQVALDVAQFSPRPPIEAHLLPDDEMLLALRSLNYAPNEALFEDAELRRLLLPAVRADFELSNRYEFRERPPLDVPLTVWGGRFDPYVNAAQLDGWQRYTTRGCQLGFRPGDHYFIGTDRDFLVRAVGEDLARIVATLR